MEFLPRAVGLPESTHSLQNVKAHGPVSKSAVADQEAAAEIAIQRSLEIDDGTLRTACTVIGKSARFSTRISTAVVRSVERAAHPAASWAATIPARQPRSESFVERW